MIRSVPCKYFFSRLCRIDFNMIGFMSVSTMRSWRVRNLPAMNSAASTFSCASVSDVSNSVSISDAVDWVMIGDVVSSIELVS